MAPTATSSSNEARQLPGESAPRHGPVGFSAFPRLRQGRSDAGGARGLVADKLYRCARAFLNRGSIGLDDMDVQSSWMRRDAQRNTETILMQAWQMPQNRTRATEERETLWKAWRCLAAVVRLQ